MIKHNGPDKNFADNFFRHVLLVPGLILFITTALAGCGSSAPTPDPAAVTGPKIGEAVNVTDGITLEVSSFTRTVGDQVSRTKRGRKWAMPTILVNNESDQTIEVDPADFTITTSSGETAQADPNIHFLPMLKATSVSSDESVQGKLGFDVPEEDQLVLHWNPKWADETTVSITLIKSSPSN